MSDDTFSYGRPNAPTQQSGGVVRGIEAVEKIILLVIIVFVIYEVFKFGQSGVGQGLSDAFGSAAAILAWFSAHPNAMLATIFGVLLAPIILAIAGGTFKVWRAKIAKAREARYLDEQGKFREMFQEDTVEKVRSATLRSQAELAKTQNSEMKSKGSLSGNEQEDVQINDKTIAQAEADKEEKNDEDNQEIEQGVEAIDAGGK